MFSALPPKADIALRMRYVRFVPTAEVILLASEGAVLHHSGSGYRGWLC
jgi:hypothetical protein